MHKQFTVRLPLNAYDTAYRVSDYRLFFGKTQAPKSLRVHRRELFEFMRFRKIQDLFFVDDCLSVRHRNFNCSDPLPQGHHIFTESFDRQQACGICLRIAIFLIFETVNFFLHTGDVFVPSHSPDGFISIDLNLFRQMSRRRHQAIELIPDQLIRYNGIDTSLCTCRRQWVAVDSTGAAIIEVLPALRPFAGTRSPAFATDLAGKQILILFVSLRHLEIIFQLFLRTHKHLLIRIRVKNRRNFYVDPFGLGANFATRLFYFSVCVFLQRILRHNGIRASYQRQQCGFRPCVNAASQVMFPNAYDPPTHEPILTIDFAVPCSIACDLILPETHVRSWCRSVIATAVPETRVNEKNDLFMREIKIWPSGQ